MNMRNRFSIKVPRGGEPAAIASYRIAFYPSHSIHYHYHYHHHPSHCMRIADIAFYNIVIHCIASIAAHSIAI